MRLHLASHNNIVDCSSDRLLGSSRICQARPCPAHNGLQRAYLSPSLPASSNRPTTKTHREVQERDIYQDGPKRIFRLPQDCESFSGGASAAQPFWLLWPTLGYFVETPNHRDLIRLQLLTIFFFFFFARAQSARSSARWSRTGPTRSMSPSSSKSQRRSERSTGRRRRMLDSISFHRE